MRYKIVFGYSGGAFYGYQVQPHKRTVQEEIEKVLSRIFCESIRIHASGRTDKGVHALNQVATFDGSKDIDVKRLKYALNCALEDDIHIASIEKCEEDFHARFSCVAKKYIYRLSINESDPFLAPYTFFSRAKYDVDRIKEAMKEFVGTYNFQNFCTNKEEESYIETIYSFTLKEEDGVFTFAIIGSGFKRYMVRLIMGSVLAYGANRISLEVIKNALHSKERNTLCYKVPPQGLFLKEVYYNLGDIKND